MSDQPAEPSDRADTNPASLAPCAWTQNKGWGPNLVLAAPHPRGDDPDRVLADGSEEAQSLTPTESNPTGTRVRYLAEFR